MELLERTLQGIKPVDKRFADEVQKRLDSLTKPPGSLGMLEDVAKRVASVKGGLDVRMERRYVVVMAADHGVSSEGVSAYPAEVTRQMVLNFVRGGAAINVLAGCTRTEVVVVDVGVNGEFPPELPLVHAKIRYGTANMRHGPAMSREEAVAALETGIRVVGDLCRRGVDAVATGDMGIGNTTASSAITAVMTGRAVEEVTGRGTGVDDEGLGRKVAVIRESIQRNAPDAGDPVDVLAKVGGLEIGGIAGVILGAAFHGLPVVIDGFISGAGALIAAALAPSVTDYLLAGHLSAERGHEVVLEHLGLEPLLRMNMRLGEGTGAVLAMEIARCAVRLLSGMATFEEAGVSERDGGG